MTHHHGADIPATISLCDLCGKHPYRYPGRRCWACWRATSGFVPEAPAERLCVPEAPAPTQRARAHRPPTAPRRVPPVRVFQKRYCLWPGCDRHHATKGACRMHFRRLENMSAVGSAPDTWPAMWENYQEELAELAIWNGAMHHGIARGAPTAALTLAQFRALRKRPTGA